jgi:hypothetical protein
MAGWSSTRARLPRTFITTHLYQLNLVLVIRADGSTESVGSTLATEDFLKVVLGHHGG